MDEATETLIDGLLDGEEAGASITWNNAAYPCCGGPELGGKLLGAGGFRVTAQVTVIVRLSLFAPGSAGVPPASPQEKQRLTYSSAPDAPARALRIDTRTVFRNALLILECNDPNEKL
jgi:hypothetical protein